MMKRRYPPCHGVLQARLEFERNTRHRLLIEAMNDFAIRVLSGQNCNAQETAILPKVLSLLLRSKNTPSETNQWGV